MPLVLDQPLVRRGDLERELARQQEVASVARRHLHDVAAAAEVLDVFLENQFNHVRLSVCSVARPRLGAR